MISLIAAALLDEVRRRGFPAGNSTGLRLAAWVAWLAEVGVRARELDVILGLRDLRDNGAIRLGEVDCGLVVTLLAEGAFPSGGGSPTRPHVLPPPGICGSQTHDAASSRRCSLPPHSAAVAHRFDIPVLNCPLHEGCWVLAQPEHPPSEMGDLVSDMNARHRLLVEDLAGRVGYGFVLDTAIAGWVRRSSADEVAVFLRGSPLFRGLEA